MSVSLPSGFRFAGVSASIKKKQNTKDIALIVSDVDAVCAGVYTQNQVVAAPVELCRKQTPHAAARAIVVNSGNANACTGVQGSANAHRMCELAGHAAGVQPHQVFVMSTGVIGHALPMEKVEAGIAAAAAQLASTEAGFLDAADAILTTDIARKISSRQLSIGTRTVKICGMAKGAGMIGPNMATMLCCVLTDACLSSDQAQRLLTDAANRSFNNISVEGHTSTNDTMLLMANGRSIADSSASAEPLSGSEEAEFAHQLTEMCIELAKQIPADGEGSKHLIEVRVSGAQSDSDARRISLSVASSNLVKTAVHGADPNWGRIVSAAGYAGVPIDTKKLSLQINGIELFRNGEPIAFDAKTASASIATEHTTLIELNVGDSVGQCTHWTSDLGVDYVRFNSEYTT